MRFSVRPSAQNALFRHAAAPGMCEATARQAAGHYGKWPNWANALEQPPASLLGGLCQGPQISVWSLDSRKSAFWRWALTEKRTLRSVSHGKTHSAYEPITKVPQSPHHVHKIYHHLT